MQTLAPTSKKQTRFARLLLSACLAFSLQPVNAATLIDDFDDFQEAHSIVQPSSGPLVISSTELSGVITRSFAISATGDADSGRMYSELGDLSIASDSGTVVNASVSYNFDNINLTNLANALVFDIESDLATQIEIIVNQSSSFVFQNSPQLTQYVVLFSSFSAPEAFAQLASMRINFHTLEDGDLLMSGISASMVSVPEPSVAALLTIGLLALRRNKIKAIPVKA
ncbi:MAG: hypothetical protein CTY19_11055 [Methylomonas sp.]|nr:MAG: hypothetical protein CTY19_11055 [Methylomonas sp.]